MKATSKLRPPDPGQFKGCVGVSKMSTCLHYIIKCSIFPKFYAVLESAQNAHFSWILGTVRNHQKANACIQNQLKQCGACYLTEYTLNTHTFTCMCSHVHVHVNAYIHIDRKYTEKSHLKLPVPVESSKVLHTPTLTADSTGQQCRSVHVASCYSADTGTYPFFKPTSETRTK